MNGFKLQEISFTEFSGISINNVKLCNNIINSKDNYYSLIIGNNGTGKSILLNKITNHYIENNNKQSIFNKIKITSTINPSKIIAITSSISDKFPNDNSFKTTYRNSPNFNYNQLKYIYLGARNGSYSYSKKAQLFRAIDILFENFAEIKTQEKYLDLFNYLNYEPVIKISFSFSKSILNKIRSKMTPDLLVKIIKSKISENNFSNTYISLLEDMLADNINDICNLMNISMNDIKHNYDYLHSTLINFSKENIIRKSALDKLRNSNFEFNEYKLILLLKKFKIVKDINFRVFKKDGSNFQFEDSSSGEANILTTLISLIPLIKDNCLILIDEPEISLHPQWQSRYIDLLKNILDKIKGCHIIIASHSHFIATDLPPNQSSIIALKRNNKGEIFPEYISESTYGWSAENILYSVFNMKTSRNYYLERELNDLLQLISEGNKKDERLIPILTNLKKLYFSNNDPILKIIEQAEEFIYGNKENS